MGANANITGGTSFRIPGEPDTGDVDVLALAAQSDFEAETNTVARIRIVADDAITGDPQTVIIALMAEGGTFTADAGTDAATDTAHGLSDNDEIRVSSTGTLPAGLSEDTPYYLVNSDANTWQFSETVGGSVVNITDAGTGTHSWQLYAAPVLTYEYPTTGPATAVRIKSNRDGGTADFTKVKGLQINLVPTVGETVRGTFTVNAGTNVITTSADHGRSVGQRIRVEPDDGSTLPAGLAEGTDYYVLTTPADDTLTVSETPGGSVVDITDAGTGTFSWKTMGDAYGEVWITMGDDSDDMNFLSIPLVLNYTAGDGKAAFAVLSLPEGITYDSSFHLTVRIMDSTTPSDNCTVLLNLLGN